jgi:anti-anti-sigma factor
VNPLLKISSTDEGLLLEGELDLNGASEFRDALEGAARRGALTIDASRLTFMDSSGLRVLVDVAGTRNGDPPLLLHRPTRAIRRLLEIGVPGGVQGLEVRG